MAQPSETTTRHGKGEGIVLVDNVDFGVLTDEITFTPDTEYAEMMKGDWPIAVRLAALKKSIGGTLKFSAVTIDHEKLAQVTALKYTAGVLTHPIDIDYMEMPKFNIKAKLSRFPDDGTPVADQDTGEVGNGAVKTFWFVTGSTPVTDEDTGHVGDDATKTFAFSTGDAPLKPGSISVHAVVTAPATEETLTDANKDGVLSSVEGGTGTVNYLTGEISVTFFKAPAATYKVEVDYTPSSIPLKPGSVSVHDELDVETLTDDKKGGLSSVAGGTGVVNYQTGKITVTFNAAVADTKKVQVDFTPKVEKYERIEIFAGIFLGEPERSYNSDNELVLTYNVVAVWDQDRCTVASGLYKIESVTVT